MICSSSSSSGSVSPTEGEITTITAAAKMLFAKTEVSYCHPILPGRISFKHGPEILEVQETRLSG